jgi:hypothetical protein
MKMLSSWQKGAHSTHLQDLNLPVVSLKELQVKSSGTVRADTGSLFQDKGMQRISF